MLIAVVCVYSKGRIMLPKEVRGMCGMVSRFRALVKVGGRVLAKFISFRLLIYRWGLVWGRELVR